MYVYYFFPLFFPLSREVLEICHRGIHWLEIVPQSLSCVGCSISSDPSWNTLTKYNASVSLFLGNASMDPS